MFRKRFIMKSLFFKKKQTINLKGKMLSLVTFSMIMLFNPCKNKKKSKQPQIKLMGVLLSQKEL